MASYAYDQEWKDERERLAGIERLWDGGSHALLDRLGVSSGWRCIEVGAGAGSMVEWLSDKVGPSGSVTAVDVSTRFLEAIDKPNVQVLRQDVLDEDLPTGFELVYGRLVVEHLGTPALERMVAAAAPGGLVVLEDYDWAAADVFPPDPLFQRVLDAVTGFMERAGYDRFFGRRIFSELRAAGLEDVQAEARARVIQGGTPETVFYRLSLESLRDPIVASGALTGTEVDEAMRRIDDPAATYVSPLMVSAWGRRRP